MAARPLIGWDIFDFFIETAERNSTNLDRKQDLNALYQVCVFRADRKNKMAAWRLIGWDIFDFFSETVWMEFKETWQESRSKRPLPSLCFSSRSEKQDGRPGLWLAETFSTSPLKPLNWIQWNFTGSKISTPSTKFVFFWADWKNKMAALASDWLRHFRLLLRNRWTEFNKTWQEASTRCLLPCLCFSGKSGTNKMTALASDWLRHFRLLLWNCERNSTKLDRKQDLNALYQVCVFHVDPKNKMAALAYDLGHF